MVNLFTNAIKYSPNNENLIISMQSGKSGELIFSLKDNGTGIPTDKLPLIFEKFIQLDKTKDSQIKSTGLGLTFCKLAIEAHGGQVGVESIQGDGTKFWFTIPKSIKSKETVQVDYDKDELLLSSPDIENFKPILQDLRRLKTYQVTEPESLIESIEKSKGSALDKYCQQLMNAAYTANEKVYHEFLDMIG